MNNITKKNVSSVRSAASGPSLTLIPQTSDTSVSIDTGNLHSPCAILVRLSDKAVLMQKQSDERIYPASLTKMMTAVMAIENIPDLQKKIGLPSSIFQPLYKADASMAGFQPGEKVRAVDLLYGALLPGGEILGGKTGYTDEAGPCLASLAKIDGEEYILVTAGAKGDHKTEQYDIDDAREVYKELS